MSKIIVTGGAGFIGSNVADALIEEGHKVAIIDNLSVGLKENISKYAKFYEADITQTKRMEEIFDEFKPEVVHHLAAQIDLRKSVAEPANDVKTNVMGTVNLLLAAVKSGCKKFIFSSTGGAIYGDGVERPTPETAEADPVSPYGINKLTSERYIKYFERTSNLKTICLRYANVFGPRQNPLGHAGVIAIFGVKLLKGEPVKISGDGEQTRDYVYVENVVQANLTALKSNVNGIFNIGSGKELSLNAVTEALQKETQSKSKVTHIPGKPGEQKFSCLSIEKAYLELGWKPEIDFEEGVRRTILWQKKWLKSRK